MRAEAGSRDAHSRNTSESTKPTPRMASPHPQTRTDRPAAERQPDSSELPLCWTQVTTPTQGLHSVFLFLGTTLHAFPWWHLSAAFKQLKDLLVPLWPALFTIWFVMAYLKMGFPMWQFPFCPSPWCPGQMLRALEAYLSLQLEILTPHTRTHTQNHECSEYF